jgi:hypothetical protein
MHVYALQGRVWRVVLGDLAFNALGHVPTLSNDKGSQNGRGLNRLSCDRRALRFLVLRTLYNRGQVLPFSAL